MAAFREDCRERLRPYANIKKEGSRGGRGDVKGKKLRLMYKARVLKNLSSINDMFMSPPNAGADTLISNVTYWNETSGR